MSKRTLQILLMTLILLIQISHTKEYNTTVYCSDCNLCQGIFTCMFLDGGPFNNRYWGCQLPLYCSAVYPIQRRVYECDSNCTTCCYDDTQINGLVIRNKCFQQQYSKQFCSFPLLTPTQIGLIVGGVVGFLIIIGVAIYCLRKKRRQQSSLLNSDLSYN